MEGGAEVFEILHFEVGEIVVAFLQLSVITLTGHSSDGQDAEVVALRQLLSLCLTDSYLGNGGYNPEEFSILLGLFCFHIVNVGFRLIGVKTESCILESFVNRHLILAVDMPAATAAYQCIVTIDTQQGHSLAFFQRQHAFVLKQHHAFGRHLTGYLSMSLEVGLVAVLIVVEYGGLDQHAQNVLHAPVKVALGDDAGAYAIQNLTQLSLCARHQHIIACTYLTCSVLLSPPVGHHKTIKAPFVTQHIFQQPAVLRGQDAVDLVVRRHDGPWLALLDGNLEATQIDFTQCLF